MSACKNIPPKNLAFELNHFHLRRFIIFRVHIKLQPHLNRRFVERMASIDTDHTRRFHPSVRAFVFGNHFGTRKVNFNILPFTNRRLQRQRDQSPIGRNIDASAIKKPHGFGIPDANGPIDIISLTTSLLKCSNHFCLVRL